MYSNISTGKYSGMSWIAFIPSPGLRVAPSPDNVQNSDGKFVEPLIGFSKSSVLHQREDSWAENKLNTVKRNAKIDNRPLPRQEVINRAKALLYSLLHEDIKPKFINPSVDGGIIVEFENKGIYYMTEMDNEDDIVFLIRDEEKTRAFDLNPENYLDQIIDRI